MKHLEINILPFSSLEIPQKMANCSSLSCKKKNKCCKKYEKKGKSCKKCPKF